MTKRHEIKANQREPDSVRATASTSLRDRFYDAKRTTMARQGRSDMDNGEFLSLLLDVFELHAEPGERPTVSGEATVPEWIECYCPDCDETAKHDLVGGNRAAGRAFFGCEECGGRIALDLLPTDE